MGSVYAPRSGRIDIKKGKVALGTHKLGSRPFYACETRSRMLGVRVGSGWATLRAIGRDFPVSQGSDGFFGGVTC